MRKTLTVAAVAAALALGAPPVADAIEAGEKIWLHGYGNWAYGKTNGNTYLNGTDAGSYDNLEFSLSVSAEPAERTSVHAQLFIAKSATSAEGATTTIDFAFAEYAFDPALKFRIGAVKQPFGIFTEVFDVGTLYPFTDLAQGIYGPAGFVAESYLGLGFTGRLGVGGGWQMQYDLYGGKMDSELSAPWAEGAADSGTESMAIRDMVGGRLNFMTPGQSLTCGVSAYTGSMDNQTSGSEKKAERHTVYGAHAEYFLGPATLRGEFARQQMEASATNAAYAEASYRFLTNWLVAARYDWSKTSLDEDAGVDDNLLKHQDIGLAVNYFFSPNFVLKLAVHQVAGNRFTSADDEAAVQDEKTTLVSFGTSFSF